MNRELFLQYSNKLAELLYDSSAFTITKGKEFRIYLDSEESTEFKNKVKLLFVAVKTKITNKIKSTYDSLIDNKEDNNTEV